jgi:hypothetical protein
MSRDRKGAVPLAFKHSHSLALSIHYVPNSSCNILPVPQPKRTSMPRPPLSIGGLPSHPVQSPTRIRFEGVHHQLRLRVCVHHRMNVSHSYMRRQKRPVPVQANLVGRLQHGATGAGVQQVWSLMHQIALERNTRRISFQCAISRNIMVPIHGTRFLPVQMRTIARERHQIRHANLVYTAPSRSRLTGTQSPFTSVVQNYKHILRFL